MLDDLAIEVNNRSAILHRSRHDFDCASHDLPPCPNGRFGEIWPALLKASLLNTV